ncbi:SDR family oxidoreductase [Isoptericola sp. NPDC057391]|uniref:SDR family oxidoreductase n=1 Tax=Isoptericola sp. NPDC057391 TaxID=3346117 RepID=UPI0036348E99
MRVVVVGGAGRIGARLVALLRARGDDAVAASRRTGVDLVTGAGVVAAVAGADAVVDVSRPATLEPAGARAFYAAGTGALLEAGRDAGVAHHVVLSVVGARRLHGAGFLQAKVSQEDLVAGSGRPYTVLAATQFFGFATGIADASTHDGPSGSEVRLPDVADQPVAEDDVAAELLRVLDAGPAGATVELGGPEPMRLPAFVAAGLAAAGDPRRVVVDPAATYFGATVTGDELLPGPGARRGTMRHADWLAARR